MATSRGAMPADPVLSATTEDNSRGGLFVRSNIANPVEGVDINGIAVGNGRITLQLNGTDVGSFTLNQTDDDTINFMVEAGSGGGGGTTNAYNAIMFDPANPDQLILSRADGSLPTTLDLSRFDDSAEIAAAIAAANIPANFTDLGDTPATISTANTGQYLTANTAGDALVWDDLPPAVITTDEIESSDNTIADTAGTQTGRVNLAARPAWSGNGGRGGNVTDRDTVNVERIILAENTGLVLNNNNGVVTIELAGEAPAQGNAGVTLTVPPPTQTAFTAPTPPSGMINADPGSTITMVTGSIMGGENNVNIPAMTDIPTGGMTATVTFPMTTLDGGAGDYGADGEYTVTTMTTVTTPMTTDNPRVITTTEMFTRFVPFFQVRSSTVPTTLAQLQAGTTSMAAFSNTTGFTADFPGTSGNFYFATTVLTSTTINAVDFGTLPLRGNVRHVGTINTMDYGNDPLAYNIYQIAGVRNGQLYRNFRTQ